MRTPLICSLVKWQPEIMMLIKLHEDIQLLDTLLKGSVVVVDCHDQANCQIIQSCYHVVVVYPLP